MPRTFQKKEISFIGEYEGFMNDSLKGRRLQPNGKKILPATVANYGFTLKLLQKFCREKEFLLRIKPIKWLRSRDLETERNYWKKFYRLFTDWLYDECGCFDNYVGQHIKIIRSFFNYLNKEKGIGAGDFHKLFYVRKEEISIFPLLPEELNYLVYDQSFEDSLSKRMKEAKDFFVFGCTVALRYSDLNALKKQNIREVNGQYYLSVRSIKTATETLIKLPPYTIAIVKKYSKLKKRLLPSFNLTNLNTYIKRLLYEAGFTQAVVITRNKRGLPVVLKPGKGLNKIHRFCDVASSHTMRRTAITTMLSLGVPEQIVRKISGHAPNSKEFYRYVSWSQGFQDQEVDNMFKELANRKMKKV